MLDEIFRQYDIRAKIGPELAVHEVYDLVRAIAYYFVQQNPLVKRVAVGADGRIHSPAIKTEVCRALQDSGLDVIFVGMCPTPVLYFSLFTMPVQAGIMITASHNGKEYNGLKLCLGTESVWGTQIQEINRFYRRAIFRTEVCQGTYEEHFLIPRYVAWLKNNFPDLIGLKTSFIIDCGNGAAGTVLPLLIKEFGWPNCHLLYPEVDGTYPNHEADPTVPHNMEELKRIVMVGDMQFGIGLDGDCDRMSPMTKKGRLVTGDALLALFAADVLKDNPQASIVFDIKCSSALAEVIIANGGIARMAPSGHSIIKSYMREHRALLGGELSCHFFFNDHYFGYDDGIYSALRLIRLLKNSGKSLDELLTIFPYRCTTPELRLACAAENQKNIIHILKDFFWLYPQAHISLLDGIRITLPCGWLLVRGSNTQSVLCIRAEGQDKKSLVALWSILCSVLVPFFTHEQMTLVCNE